MPQLSSEEYSKFKLMLSELEPVIPSLYDAAKNFVSDQIEREKQYGECVLVSIKQMKWLTDLHKEFVGTEAEEPNELGEGDPRDRAGW